uniref:Uncharacterized protein n=1 Tax=Vespula pensylvanica TaxID=30213 RepID=A0A834NYZ3_VESPE|nr:hypothetical protein H0235_009570 [Vespula pensylvanica]
MAPPPSGRLRVERGRGGRGDIRALARSFDAYEYPRNVCVRCLLGTRYPLTKSHPQNHPAADCCGAQKQPSSQTSQHQSAPVTRPWTIGANIAILPTFTCSGEKYK